MKSICLMVVIALCLAQSVYSAKDRSGATHLINGTTGAPPATNSTNNTTPTNNTQPTNTTQPGNNTQAGNNTQPAVNNTQPAANNTQPAANNTQPAANNTQPAANNTQPTTNTTQPTNNTSNTNSTTNTTQPTNNTSNTNSTTNTTTPVVDTNWYSKNDINMTSFTSDCLGVHNEERAMLGLPPLVWSDSLAATATAWSKDMAVNGFRHSRGPYGENIASSTYSTYTIWRLLGLWTKEKNWFIPGCKTPHCSSTGQEVGHYTQMIWSKTTQVGCGFAPGVNKRFNYLTCQYLRAGNVIGQSPY